MKNILFLVALLINISKSHSQSYSFTQSIEPYTSLESGVSLNKEMIWSGFQSFPIPIGFTFSFMDSTFINVSLEATGRLIFDDSHYYYADMFVVAGMQDKGISNSLSPLSYHLTGAPGNQILKIEIKNATYKNDLKSTVNYQIWLYEESGTIELHMGPSNISNSEAAFWKGPFSGVFNVTSFSPTTFAYGYSLIGSSSLPSDTSFVGSDVNDFDLTLDSIPPDSTVFGFYFNSSTLLNTSK